MTPQLTHQEIERLRQIVIDHDKKNFGGMKEFDLNNPPQEPYRYQEFPRLLYRHGTDKTKVVRDQEQLEAALADGWSMDAVAIEYKEPKLNKADAAEARAIDRELRKPKKAE